MGCAIRPQGIALITVHLTESCGIRNWNDVKAFLKQHREARDRGEERPVTAHELYERSKRNVELG